MTEQLLPADPTLGAGVLRQVEVVAGVTDPAGLEPAPPAGVTGLEVRADLAGDLDPRALRRRITGRLTYTLRSAGYGGRGPDRTGERRPRLLAAARGYDLVDLEADRDLEPDLLAEIPAHRRRISWYGPAADAADLRDRFNRMARIPAALYLLAPRADSFATALAPLRLLGSLGRTDVTAFGTGPDAAWSRILAPWLGAPVVYGGPEGPTAEQLVTDYPFPALPPLDSLYGIVGRSLNTSLFLRLFNAAYRVLSLPSLFLPFTVPDAEAFRHDFWPGIAAAGLDWLGVPVCGLTVAAPYKGVALSVADTLDPSARAAGAANLLLRHGARWQAVTTDGSAALAALLAAAPVAGRTAAVVGCGGAGRAAATALRSAGARVTLVNRGERRGRGAADALRLPYIPLAAFHPARYTVVVHATPVHDEIPFDVAALGAGAVVADFVCATGPTALVEAARRRGLTAVDGRKVLAREAAHQFRLMTGQSLPATVPL